MHLSRSLPVLIAVTLVGITGVSAQRERPPRGDPQHRIDLTYQILPTYYGLYEDNDPSKRLMVIADYNNDVPEYWEWSDTGLFAIDASNEAYKLGVNYIVYGLTH